MLIKKLKNKVRYITSQIEECNKDIKENKNQISEIMIAHKNNYNELNNKIAELTKELNLITNLNNEVIYRVNNLKKFENYNPEYSLLDDKTKKILICGFFGADNLGDEMMLKTLLEYFPENSRYEIWIMLANNNKYDIYKNGYYHYIHYPQSKFDIQFLAKKFDKIIFCGGAHIDPDNYERDFTNELSFSTILIDLSTAMIKEQKDVFLLGLSTTKKINNEKYIKRLQYVIDNSNYFSLRDSNSLETLTNAEIETQNIKIQADIVIANKQFITKKVKPEKDTIGVILICNEELKETNRIIITELSKLKKYKITLIPFYDYLNNDYNHYQELISSIKNKENIDIVKYTDDMDNLKHILENVEFVISGRYHGILISMILNKKILGLNYDKHPHYENKIKYLYQKYSKEKNLINYSELNKTEMNKCLNSFLKNAKFVKFNQNEIFKASKDLENLVKIIVD